MKFLLFFLFFIGATTSGRAALQQTDSAVPSKVWYKPVVVNKTQLLHLVNEVRKTGCQCGDTYYYPVPPLVWNDRLEQAALAHSADMFQHQYFSHIAPDGSRAGERMEQAGYHWMMFGENIGMGYKNEVEMMKGWLQSPGHCKNIMNKDFKEMGVARVGNYWTQIFGRQ